MNNPYDLHSWSKLYREEALREARKRDRRIGQASDAAHGTRGLWRVDRVWKDALALLRAV